MPSSAPDPHNAVITWLDDPAEAKPGPLSGKTLLVKDLFDTAGVRTTYGSKLYADHVPARTAPSVAQWAPKYWSGSGVKPALVRPSEARQAPVSGRAE